MAIDQRVRALRKRLKKTQEGVAEASGVLTRTEINKIEGGDNQATAMRVRRGLARAFGTTTDDMDDYLEEKIDLDELLRRRERPRAVVADDIPEELRAVLDRDFPEGRRGTAAHVIDMAMALWRSDGGRRSEQDWIEAIDLLSADAARLRKLPARVLHDDPTELAGRARKPSR